MLPHVQSQDVLMVLPCLHLFLGHTKVLSWKVRSGRRSEDRGPHPSFTLDAQSGARHVISQSLSPHLWNGPTAAVLPLLSRLSWMFWWTKMSKRLSKTTKDCRRDYRDVIFLQRSLNVIKVSVQKFISTFIFTGAFSVPLLTQKTKAEREKNPPLSRTEKKWMKVMWNTHNIYVYNTKSQSGALAANGPRCTFSKQEETDRPTQRKKDMEENSRPKKYKCQQKQQQCLALPVITEMEIKRRGAIFQPSSWQRPFLTDKRELVRLQGVDGGEWLSFPSARYYVAEAF